MRILTQNELVQLTGGIQNYGVSNESRPFILGAGIGAIVSAMVLETTPLGTFMAAIMVGGLFSMFIDPESLPKRSHV